MEPRLGTPSQKGNLSTHYTSLSSTYTHNKCFILVSPTHNKLWHK
jgi:hypothetical protein